MKTSELLNPKLYNCLCDIFDNSVEIVNQGETGDSINYTFANRTTSKYYVNTIETAQQFKVNCPVCGDKRQRLYIHYLVGKRMTHKGLPAVTHHLFRCHNEGCNVWDLYKDIMAKYGEAEEDYTLPEGTVTQHMSFELPVGAKKITHSRASVAAKYYMTERGYDIDELWEKHGAYVVDYIPEVSHMGPQIIFPLIEGGKVAMWQSRVCLNEVPKGWNKYYFPPGSPKSKFIYNRDNCIMSDTIVITEGVTDAIRIGSNADIGGVAIFGKCPSTRQTQILKIVFGKKRCVLMLDNDAEKEAIKWYEQYKDVLFDRGLYLLRIEEEGKDPGDYTREQLHQMITDCINKGEV